MERDVSILVALIRTLILVPVLVWRVQPLAKIALMDFQPPVRLALRGLPSSIINVGLFVQQEHITPP